MNKNLEKTLKYFMGTVAAYCAFIGFLFLFTKDLSWIINYTLLLTILGWCMYLQLSQIDFQTNLKNMQQDITEIKTNVALLKRGMNRASRGTNNGR